MSYCRFSSDNFNCDAYAWEDCSGGYRLEVASKRQRKWWRLLCWLTDIRHTIHRPRPGDIKPERYRFTMRFHRAWVQKFQMLLLLHTNARIMWYRIKHPMAGTSHHFETEKELFTMFHTLYAEGFNIPKHLLTHERTS